MKHEERKLMKKETLIVNINEDWTGDQLIIPASLLAQGENVAFPTETVYGLGGNALDERAVSGIYEAKGRPSDNPLIVHISDQAMLNQLAIEVNPYAYALMDAFWPGPLTVVLKKNPNVSDKVTGGLDTVAVRMPSHPIALELIRLSGVPVAAPSANLSGKPSPTRAEYVIEDLMGRVSCIVAAGASEVGLESTVVDATGEVPVILRPGVITQGQISRIAGACLVDPGLSDQSNLTAPKSPGMKYRHYAPEAEVHVYTGDIMKILKAFEASTIDALNEGKKVGLMMFEEDLLVFRELQKPWPELWLERVFIRSEGSSKNLETFAKNLFSDLRDLDTLGCDLILIHGAPDDSVGQAIMNRLEKASEGRVYKI